MTVAVEALAVLERVIVAGEGERLGHLLVGERPVAVLVVEVVGPVLEEDADWLARRLADERRIIVAALAQRRPTGDVDEAADPGEDFAELIGALPGDREGANTAAADPA